MGFPPSRPEDHRISLLPGSIPPNIRPYCYPFQQKTEIDMLVQDLLKQWDFHLQDQRTIVLCSFLEASLPTLGPIATRFTKR